MGKQYTDLTVTAAQARWEAAGRFYARQANNRPASAIAADQARWEAAGKFYAR
jgi:hypothetical protein